jgi:lysophospholipase L1-like esterase
MKRRLVASVVLMSALAFGERFGQHDGIAAAATLKTVVIDWRGDSTFWGAVVISDGPPARYPQSPARRMQIAMNEKFGPGKVTIVDHSAPGSTLETDLSGTGLSAEYGNTLPLAAELSNGNANIVITNSQINDALAGNTVRTFSSNLKRWIRTVQASGKIPVIAEPNPICFRISIADSRRYVSAENATASRNDVIVLPLYDAFLNLPAWRTTSMASDCIHPNAAGYAFKQQQYFASLEPIVARLLGEQ